MNIIDKIDDICVKVQQVPLSALLVQILPIALECEDYEGYSILSCWNKPLCNDKEANKVFLDQISNVIENEGLSHKDAMTIVSIAHEKYMFLRTIEKDKLLMFSAKEMEDKIAQLSEMLQSLTLPQGLHPTDAYFKNQSIDKSKAVIIENKDILQRQYAALQSYIVAKLAEYRRKIEMSSNNTAKSFFSTSKMDKNEPVIFLSHCSSDKKYGNALERLLVGMGIKNHQLIYTSHPLHKVPLGKNIYDYLRDNIDRETFVIILWSNKYLESPACLNEMGAAWVMQTDYTNMYTPDFSFGNPKYHECAVDTRKMGAVLNGDSHCKASMIEFKNIVCNMFDITIEEQAWTFLLDQFISDITVNEKNSAPVESGIEIVEF